MKELCIRTHGVGIVSMWTWVLGIVQWLVDKFCCILNLWDERICTTGITMYTDLRVVEKCPLTT